MKLRLSLLAILLAAVAFLVAQTVRRHSFRRQAQVTSASAPAPEIRAFHPLSRDSSLRLDALRERVLAPYRLRPDRRLLLAIAEIRRLAGASDSAVTAEFGAGRWRLFCGTQSVGELSELPDFQESLELLAEWARKQAWPKGWADDSGPDRSDLVRALDRLDAPSALREADRAWAGGARDAALFRSASRAYSMLALETPEGGEVADAIVARSLATLAFALALGDEGPKREACLLAEVMGYSAKAAEWARKLPARDPLRLYVTWDDAGLERAAAAALPPQSAAARAPDGPASSTPP